MEVYIPKREDMRKFYYEHIGEYVLSHPGEFILVERGSNCDRETGRIDLKVSFFREERALSKEINAKYGSGAENYFFTVEIPKEYIPGISISDNRSSTGQRENRNLVKKLKSSSRIRKKNNLLEVTG